MGLYFKKSFGSGPFRINLSKSGISYSVGTKGARVNFSNRGTYVNFGSNGIYYRKKISDYNSHPTTQTYTPINYEQHTITSSKIEEITDIDSLEFINELNEKSNKISYLNWFGIFPLILSTIIIGFLFFNPTKKIETKGKTSEVVTLVQPFQISNTNVRVSPNKTAPILGVINASQKFKLIDSSSSGWYKVDFNGREGFVSKKFSKQIVETNIIENVITSEITLFQKSPKSFLITIGCLFITFILLIPYLIKVDNHRLLVEIYYDIDESIKDVYQKFVYHFSEILNCSKVWQYIHAQATNDYKYSSGAGTTITRKPLTKISKNKKPSSIFKTNVEIPYLGLINTELYFFPERLIIKRGNQFGAIMYKHVECYGNSTRFIDSESVPADAIIVGHTWRYLNKDGSPDRRFKNNYQIPICNYSEYTFKSLSGLNEKIATSKLNGFDNFFRYIKAIGQLQQHIPTDRTSSEINKRLL